MPPALAIQHLTKTYGTTAVVHDVSFAIAPGEVLGLVGESGSGKSTIARMILRLIEPTSGTITFNDQDLLAATPRALRHLRRSLQMVFQDPYAALNPRMTVAQILAEPFAIHPSPADTRATIRTRIAALLEEVGLDASALPRYPHQFSGGQRQRINIARALALNPTFMVLDEPISALDVSVGAQVINLLRTLQRTRGLTCLFISHSMPLVRYLCDRVAVLERGHLVEIGPVLEVCDAPTHPYTQRLIAATPHLPAHTQETP